MVNGVGGQHIQLVLRPVDWEQLHENVDVMLLLPNMAEITVLVMPKK